jgi:hypothetical protein
MSNEDTDDGNIPVSSYPDKGQSSLVCWHRRAIRGRLDPRQTTLSEWTGQVSTPDNGSTLYKRIVRTVLTPSVVVVIGLVIDLSLRTFVDIRPVLFTLTELLTPVVSLSAGTVTPSVIVRVTTWLVLLTVLYAVTPRLSPRAVRSKLGTVGFRLLFVGIAAIFGMIFGANIPPTLTTTLGVIWLICSLVTAMVYFRWRSDWDLLDPEGEGTAFVDSFMPEDMVAQRRKYSDRTGWIGSFLDTLSVLLPTQIICISALCSGLLMWIVLQFQPLPDLLAVGVLASGLLGRSSKSYRIETANIEERVLTTLRVTTQSFKRQILMFLLVINVAAVGAMFSTTLRIAPVYSGIVESAIIVGRSGPPDVFTTAWVAVGAVVCALVGQIQLLWVLIRLFRRFPSFLAEWRGAEAVPSMSTARPPGWILPGLLALATGRACRLLLLHDNLFPTVRMLWPLGIVPALFAPILARQRDRTLDEIVPETEHHYLVASLVLPLLLYVGSEAFDHLSQGQPLTLTLLEGEIGFVIVLAILPVAAYLPDVERYSESHDDVRQFSTGVCLGVTGSILAVSSVIPTLYRGVGVMMIVGALGSLLIRVSELP